MIIKDLSLVFIGGIVGAIAMDWWKEREKQKGVEGTLNGLDDRFDNVEIDCDRHLEVNNIVRGQRADLGRTRKPYLVGVDIGEGGDKTVYNKIVNKYRGPVEEVPNDDDEPYLIDFDQYGSEYEDFEKEILYFYKRDEVLTDDQEGLINDITNTIGSLNVLQRSPDDVVYIRNERLSIDYEVIIHDGSYRELVLGEHSG